MSNLLKKAAAVTPSLDDLIRDEITTKARVDGLSTKLDQLQRRLDHPEPGDTRETQAQIESEIAETLRDLRIAKGNYDRLAAARAEAQKAAAREQIDRETAEMIKRTEEIVRTIPGKIRGHAKDLVELQHPSSPRMINSSVPSMKSVPHSAWRRCRFLNT